MKNEKRENKTAKFICLVLLLCVIAMILVAGTYAKYTSSASGSDTATVAKWDISAGKAGEEVSITGANPTVAFNLFDTILDSDAATAETDVAATKIAPGTSGAFELSVKNSSEVNAEYSVTFNLGTSTIPLEFRVNGGEWKASLDEVDATAIAQGATDTAKVEWRWAFENNRDADDTTLGITPESVTVEATLTVDQVD